TSTATDPLHTGVASYQHTSTACFDCHPRGTSPVPADHDASFFPRGSGTAHATVGCAQCHTDFSNAKDPANFACETCHAALSGWGTAHANVSSFTGSEQSADCLKCHGDGVANAISTHTKFPIQKGSTTHDTVCLQCHDTLRTDKAFAADFSAYDCLGCHAQPATDSAHSGVAGYLYGNASCYGCHPSGTAAPANHDTALFPAIGSTTIHAQNNVTCTECHTDLAHPDDPANFACASCHNALSGFAGSHDPAQNAALNGVAILTVRTSCTSSTTLSLTDPASCLGCHADSQVNTVASHPGDDDAFGTGAHRTAGCLTCHVAMRTDKTFATDFNKSGATQSSPGCATCHQGGCGGGG
ncbi:MAG TPA: hypothetical protein VFG59_15610, partial [Anaeromyxobacter sp.]|nr:hypothetical protein [Anaeromyxobacter sp.]